MEKKKPIILTVIASVTLILLVVGATYAYFQAQGGIGTSADIRVTTYTTDLLTFTTGNDIAIYADQANFAEGLGNKSGETFARAHLLANSKTNTATANYYVFLSINNNTFWYTQEDKTPELILQVTDPNGTEVTSLSGLEYKTVTDGKGQTIKGFDVTALKGLVTIANNYEIVANNEATQTWNVKLVFVNLDADQTANAGHGLEAKLMIQKELLLSAYVQSLYTGTQGENNIYYHNLSLENGAEDYSYRFSGADGHEAYYTCTYDGNEVYSTRSILLSNSGKLYDNNRSYQGDCAKVYTTTFNGSEVYFDKSVYDSGTTVTWDSTNSKCTTSSGTQVYTNALELPTETECTGNAYKFKSAYFLMNMTEAGTGTEALYEEAGGVDNNYVCFGSTETPCPHENLYRIIGVIDGKVRLIKADVAKSSTLGTDGDYQGNIVDGLIGGNIKAMHLYITGFYSGEYDLYDVGSYSWNYINDTEINNGKGSNTWSTSLLNKVNLNTNFLNNIGTEWSDKIEVTSWKVGGTIVDSRLNSKETYQIEFLYSQIYPEEFGTTDGKTTYDAKVGLMYISDYGYAYENSHWAEKVLDYGSLGLPLYNNWMEICAWEWTISRDAGSAYFVVALTFGSARGEINTVGPIGVRPSFNLTSNIKYVRGSGTKENPIIID